MTDTISPLGRVNASNRPTDGSTNEVAGELAPPTTLQKLQSMAVMGELSEAVAHDFNNIISATLIHLGLLLQDPLLNAGQKESLKMLVGETTRAAALTRQLLSFSRRRFAAKTEPVDLNQLLRGVEKLLEHLVRENVFITFQPAAEECWIEGDIGEVEKLVMSLCLVSRDLMPKGGRLILKTNPCHLAECPTTGDAIGAKQVVGISFTSSNSDDLPGKGPSDIAAGESGWQLDTARQLAEEHGGWIEIKREAARTEIHVYFPALKELERSRENSESPDEIRGGSETILLIEDEDFLRRVCALSLRKLGYAVLDAADGDAALKLWEKHGQNIDLLFADLLLPGAESGYELAQLFTAQKPALRVMLSSGNHADLEKYSQIEGPSFFKAVKPYTASRMAQMVRECLDASS